MPSIPSQSQLTKRSKCHKLLPAITAVTIISIHSIILPSLYNNLPRPMRTSQLLGQEYMDEVLHAVNRLVPKYIKLPSTSKTCVSITSNSKFYTYFNDYILAYWMVHTLQQRYPMKTQQHIEIERAGYLKMYLHVASLTIHYS